MRTCVEVLLQFETEEEAQLFIDKHVSKYSDEPWIAKKVKGYVIRETTYPESPEEEFEIRVRSRGWPEQFKENEE